MSTATTIELTPVQGGVPGDKDAEIRRSDDAPVEQHVVLDRTPSVVEKKGTTAVIITTIAGVTTTSSLVSGIVTIALPIMAKDLNISSALLFW